MSDTPQRHLVALIARYARAGQDDRRIAARLGASVGHVARLRAKHGITRGCRCAMRPRR